MHDRKAKVQLAICRLLSAPQLVLLSVGVAIRSTAPQLVAPPLKYLHKRHRMEQQGLHHRVVPSVELAAVPALVVEYIGLSFQRRIPSSFLAHPQTVVILSWNTV